MEEEGFILSGILERGTLGEIAEIQGPSLDGRQRNSILNLNPNQPSLIPYSGILYRL